jgi:hypothetical protein
MVRNVTSFALALVVALLTVSTAQAWHVDGHVFCDSKQNGLVDDPGDLPLENVLVKVVNTAGTFMATDLTHDGGHYLIILPDSPDSYTLSVDAGTLPGDAMIVVPAGGQYSFSTNEVQQSFSGDFLIKSAVCGSPPPPSLCWMTGGGVKFETITRTWNAQSGPKDTVGGVVYPSCSQFPADGGNWNHIAHSLKLHLKGQQIRVIRCGNVEGIPPGTTSPVCSVNFIEFQGTGVLQGIQGNKFSSSASFFGRVEDRNEPGNEQAADSGALVDRYFLRVVDGGGVLRILIDADGVDDGKVDPLTITGGNFQIHCTSCGDGSGASLSPLSRIAYFLRGDANTDGTMGIADAIYSLSYLFLDGPAPRCFSAADVNDDGKFNITDPLMSLLSMFSAGPPVPAPYPEAGLDPSEDLLECSLLSE